MLSQIQDNMNETRYTKVEYEVCILCLQMYFLQETHKQDDHK